MLKYLLILLLFFFLSANNSHACSVIYYIDKITGKIYVANSEDYWYDVKAYIRIEPGSKNKLARLWYGWDNFAQGGINEAGLFFDGAVTPEQKVPENYNKPEGNLGDEILSKCNTVKEAITLLEEKNIVLSNAHMMLGDSTGYAVVMEWIDWERIIYPIQDNMLIMTNFLLSDPSAGNYPCPRFNAIESSLNKLTENNDTVNLLTVGNALAKAVQSPIKNEEGRTGGTLYSTFIDVSEMEFVLVYQLDNSNITRLNLKEEFAKTTKRKIKLSPKK